MLSSASAILCGVNIVDRVSKREDSFQMFIQVKVLFFIITCCGRFALIIIIKDFTF